MNREKAFSLNARILSLSVYPERADAMPEVLSSFDEEQWKLWVYYSGKHLILPGLYYNLHQHGLIPALPTSLNQYLQQVFSLNTERNEKIREQSLDLNRMLQQNGIQPVFLKGTGHLCDHLYAHPGMRMMSDIDVVVPPHQVLSAARLLMDQGYFSHKPYNPKAFDSTLHYPMLVHEDRVAGIEVHARVLNYLYDGLLPHYPHGLVSARSHPDVTILSMDDRMVHNFVHTQLMHSHHYTGILSLKDMYDYFLMRHKGGLAPRLRKHQSSFLAYQNIIARYFECQVVRTQKKATFTYTMLRARHRASLNFPVILVRFHYFTVMVLQKYFMLPLRSLWNPTARNFIWSRITHPGWFQSHLQAWKRLLKRK